MNGRIENWAVVYKSNNYQAPETIKCYINGEIYDSESFKDGSSITTSSIKEMDITNMIVLTNNSLYKLGKPRDMFITWLKANNKELKNYHTALINEE